MSNPAPNSLLAEAVVLSRYLLSRDPGPALADRYARACIQLMPEVPAADQRLIDVALRRPWLLGPLDSATALLRPGATLRKKLLLMSAILETTPEHADRFLPRAPFLAGLVSLLAVLGLKSAFQVPVGAVVLWSVERGR